MASPVPIPDNSFETVPVGAAGGTYLGNAGVLLGAAPNWDSSGNGGNGVQSVTNGDIYFDAATLPAPADGTNFFYMNIATAEGYCWQDIGPLASNTTYTLTIAVGEELSGESGVGFIGLINGQSPFGTILATTPVDTSTWTPGTFSNVTVTYTTGAKVSGDLTILMQGESGEQLVFDNVLLDGSPAANPTALAPIVSSIMTSNSVYTGTELAPETNTVYIGSPVTLTEVAAGAAPFAYQWYTDNGSGGASFSPVSGATASTLALDTSSFVAGLPVEYEVVVTSSGGSSTSAPVFITGISGPPVMFVDTLPTLAADVVGNNLKFTASFIGSAPMSFQWQVDTGGGPNPIPGATNQTFTLTNMQLSDSGSYSLVASNAYAVVSSDPGILNVGTAQTNDADGVIVSTAYQDGLGTNSLFTPTWTLPTNSLIAGLEPVVAVPNVAAFQYGASGGVPVLTDGSPGTMPPAGNTSPNLAVAGLLTQPVGSVVGYKFPTNGAPYGWTITNITVYGGWADAGRIEQEYNIYTSTYSAPTNYGNVINPGGSSGGNASVDFNYPDPTAIDPFAVQCATRVTLTSTNGALAANAGGLELDFSIQAKEPENAWEGYGEIQVFGYPSAQAVLIVSNIVPSFAGDVAGSSVTFTSGFASSSPLAYQWFVNTGGGATPVPGGISPILTLSNLQYSDAGTYYCVASNASGSATTASGVLAVSSPNGTDPYGAIDNGAYQAAAVQFFSPTWTLPAGDLLSNVAPSAVGSGQYNDETASGVNVLTDGAIGGIGGGNDIDMATGGPNAGTAVYYQLLSANAPNGYTITNVQVFGGWSDHGRDENYCIVYYSTPIAPNEYTNTMAIWDFLPPSVGAIANMTRVSSVSGIGSALATNVAGIEIAFAGGENGYEGYSEIAAYGFPSSNSVVTGPQIERDIIPFIAGDVPGSSVTMGAVFTSSSPMSYQWYFISGGVTRPVSGATSPSLTLTGLATNNAGAYFVVASNELGTMSSHTNTVKVYAAPAPTGGVIQSLAYQQTYAGGPELQPTWTVPAGDLLLGLQPSSSTGDFTENGNGPISDLTDGSIGYVGGTVDTLCSCGLAPEGSQVTYTLPGSANGFSLTEVVTFGGWQDAGRDQQNYTLSYATASNPSQFITLTSVAAKVNTNTTGSLPNMSRITISSATGGVLASNVVALQFNFASPSGQENNWEGYSELAAYGNAVESISFSSAKVSGTNLVLNITGGIAGAPYTLLSATNLLGPWVTNSSGTFSSSGTVTNTIPISRSVAGEFFRVEAP